VAKYLSKKKESLRLDSVVGKISLEGKVHIEAVGVLDCIENYNVINAFLVGEGHWFLCLGVNCEILESEGLIWKL
jgi:hypothetical protein